MTEWWVSTKKHFCEICKVWTGGHIRQINKHKEGRMHIEHEEKMLKDAREREKQRQKDEGDLKSQLEAIELAAAAAMARDAQAAAAAAAGGAGAVAVAAGGVGGAVSGEAMAAQKAQIQETVDAAKRRKMEAVGLNADSPPGSPWTRHTDPTSGVYYYYNAGTGQSSWQEPTEFAAALDAALAGADAAAAAAPKAAASAVSAPSTAGVAEAAPVPVAAVASAAAPFAGIAAKACGVFDAGGAGGVGMCVGGPPKRPRRMPYNEEAAVREASARVADFCRVTPEGEDSAPASASSVPSPPSAAVSTSNIAAAPGTIWVVCTDPNSGLVYYFNRATGVSSWEKPPELAVDLSKPPPPPSAKPPPPPRNGSSSVLTAAGVGMWEEVEPEDSMWQNPEESREAPAEPDSDDEEEMPNPFAQVKESLMGRKGMWADEDLELREKEMFVGSSARSVGSGGGAGVSASAASASVPSFPIARARAAGIRRRAADG